MFSWMQVVVAIVFLIPVLCLFSHRIKFYVKMFIFYSLAGFAGIALIFTSFFVKRRTDNFKCAGFMFNRFRNLFGIKVDVIDREILDSDSSYILVSNHQSSLDLMGMSEIVPTNCTCLAKKELKYGAGPFGIALWLSGSIFIDRSDRGKSMSTMTQVAKIIKRDNVKVWIFPEGKRNENGSLLPFKKGAFHLAVEAQVPVVPVVFSSYSSFYSQKHKVFDTGHYTITCLPPVSTKGMTLDDVNTLTERVRNLMLNVFQTAPEKPEGQPSQNCRTQPVHVERQQ